MDPYTGSYKLYNYGTSQVINVDDIDILVHSHDKFRHIGAEFSVGGSTFNLAIKESKNSMKFYVDHENHIVDNVEGLLGFTMAKSYEVKYRSKSTFKFPTHSIFTFAWAFTFLF